jgi:hypothetical protein
MLEIARGIVFARRGLLVTTASGEPDIGKTRCMTQAGGAVAADLEPSGSPGPSA